MATSFKNIKDSVMAACKDTAVASVSPSISGDWASYHVFYNTDSYVGARNRGRCPFVEVIRNDTSMEHLAEPSYGGMSTHSFTILVHTLASSGRDEEANEEEAWRIAIAILEVLRADYNLSTGNNSITEIENSPFGYSLAINVEVDITFDIGQM